MPTDESKLIVKFEAENKKLHKELDRTKKRMDRFEKGSRKNVRNVAAAFNTQAARIKKALGGVAAALAAAVSVRGLTNLYRETAKSIDQQAKFARRIGISTKEMAGLQLAGDYTGVSVSQLNMGLQRMTRRVSEAAQGTGEAKDAIAELGLDAQALARMSPDQQFREIAEAMKDVTSQGDKVRLAMKLFDSEGVALVNTLELGKQGLNDVAAEASDLGIALNEISAAQVEAANDAMRRAAAIAEAGKIQFTTGMAPAVRAVAEELSESARQMSGLGSISDEVGRTAATSFGWIGDTVEAVTRAINRANVQVSKFNDLFLRMQRGVRAASPFNIAGRADDLAAFDEAIEQNRRMGRESAKAYKESVEREMASGSFSERIARRMGLNNLMVYSPTRSSGIGGLSAPDTTTPLQARGAEFRVDTTARDNILSTFADMRQDLQRQIDLYGEVSEAAKLRYDIEEGLIEGLSNAQADILVEMQGRIDTLNSEAELIAEIEAEVKRKSEEMSAYADQMARNIQDAFSEILFDPFQNGLDGMRDGFSRMVRQILSQALSADIAAALNLPGAGSGGNTSALVDAGLSLFGGSFADGGRPDPNKISIVGERGPEMFIPDGVGGTVLPNGAMPDVHIKNINVSDPSIVGDYIATDAGQRVIVNVIQRNRGALGI